MGVARFSTQIVSYLGKVGARGSVSGSRISWRSSFKAQPQDINAVMGNGKRLGVYTIYTPLSGSLYMKSTYS